MSRPAAFALALPLLLLSVMAGVFALCARWLGDEAGYLLGFACYWLVWCLLVPWLMTGRRPLAALLRDRASLFTRRNWPAALVWLLVVGIAVAMYAGEFVAAPPALIWLAVPLATVNGVCEEILWRGLYVNLFPRNPWLGLVYPALGFALWHLAPQVVFPAASPVGLVVSTFFLGLAYGFIARRTGSARWPAVSHSVSGIMALSGALAPALLTLEENAEKARPQRWTK